MADQLAVQGAVADRIDDFSGLVKSEQRRIFLLCLRLLQDREEADSITQEVFLKAYRALQKAGPALDEPARWLTRIAVNTCLDLLRSRRWKFWRRRAKPEQESLILDSSPAAGPTAEDFVFAKQIDARLQVAMERLSPRQRAVFTLRHYEDLSMDQIATTLGLDVGTVKAHLSRAVAKLREDLKELYAELSAR